MRFAYEEASLIDPEVMVEVTEFTVCVHALNHGESLVDMTVSERFHVFRPKCGAGIHGVA